MKYLIIFFTIILFTTNAYSQDAIVLKYEYEEGAGQIIFDSSGFNNDASNFNMNWVTPSAFGNLGGEFDGGNDYLTTTLILGNSPKVTFGTWVYPYSNNLDTIVDIENGVENKYELQIQGSGTTFEYRDDSQTLQTIQLENENFPINQYTHIAFAIDTIQEEYYYWRDGVLITTGNFPTGYNAFEGSTPVRFGADFNLNNDYQGILDSTFLLNFLATTEQINEMIQQNNIEIIVEEVEEEEVYVGFQDLSLIVDNYEPFQNQQITFQDLIKINLGSTSTCEFYVDSKLYRTGYNQSAYSWNHDLSIGNYDGSFYCYYDNNETRYYELIPSFPFEVIGGDPSIVQFQIQALDFDLSQTDLWVTSPCLEEGYSAIGTEFGKYRPQYNPNGAYFSEVKNGIATFNLSSGENDFCLHNGRIIVNEEGKTNNYDVVESLGRVDLGTIDVPVNEGNFIIKISQFDIYEVYDPKAYGKTWSGIMGGLILVLFGGLICIAGVKSNNGKIVVAGALIFMAGFGISTTGLVGILL